MTAACARAAGRGAHRRAGSASARSQWQSGLPGSLDPSSDRWCSACSDPTSCLQPDSRRQTRCAQASTCRRRNCAAAPAAASCGRRHGASCKARWHMVGAERGHRRHERRGGTRSGSARCRRLPVGCEAHSPDHAVWSLVRGPPNMRSSTPCVPPFCRTVDPSCGGATCEPAVLPSCRNALS